MHHRRSRKFTHVSPCVKFSIFVSNFIILLFGCLLLFIGLYASYDKIRIANSLRFDNVYDIVVNLSLVIIVTGSLIFAISFTGCIGALRENTCLLSFYTLCLVCLFVVEIGVAMVGLVFPQSISQILEQNFSNKAISLYQDDVNLQSLVNYVQQEFQCCGLSSAGYLDWSLNEYFNCTTRDSTTNSGIVLSESCDVPFSCCLNPTDTMCGKGMQKLPIGQASERIWTSGCVETIRVFVEHNLHRIAIVALIAATLQMFFIYLTRSLEKQIYLQKALRQRKQKLLPQNHHHSHHHRRPRNFTYVSSCVKFSIFVLNFTFWLLGCLLIAVGLYASYDKWTATGSLKIDNLYDFIINLSLVLMVTGSLVFVVSFAGCIGALRENTCLLSFYILCLLCLFLFELGIAVTGFVFPHSLNSVLEQNFSDKVISSYRDDIDLQNFINYIQKEFQCCGLSSAGYLDWSKNEYFNCTTYDALANSAMSFSESCDVPFSCCVNATDAMCGKGVQKLPVAQASRRIWTSGCIEVIRILVERHLYRIAVGALITALSQMFIIYLARTLEGQIDLQKSQWHHR